ncbi:MAG: hypothetical protein JST04_02090 [Bdellovibrionales bacterium]|nr:hypothetical protein [Bdellovibrionales bacterium]
MWSSTNQRIKALMSARAREKDRLTRPIHVRRADVSLNFRDERDFLVQVPARVLLNDLTPAGFCVYAVTGLNPNAEITVEIEHPKHFRLTAKVVWCQYQSSSMRVLTSESFRYRVGLALIWTDTALEEEFRKYCEELDGLYVNKKALFLEEAFKTAPETSKDAESAATANAGAAKDPNDVPAPTESDEGGAPSEEKVAAEMAAAAAAEVAAQALKDANPPAAAAPTSDTSAADVLNALKDIDSGTPAAATDEKKAA